ncbi:hypothetical protein ACWZEH_02115 [Streptomyces sp. QTS137]
MMPQPGRAARLLAKTSKLLTEKLGPVAEHETYPDVARLSPFKDRHLDFLGRYRFGIKTGRPGQGLRPFRDPDATKDDGED